MNQIGNNVAQFPPLILYRHACGWGVQLDFRIFLYCMARQHQAQKASNQRHGQPTSTDILERVSQNKRRYRRDV